MSKKLSHSESWVFHAPWEKTFNWIITPFEEFLRRQISSSILLVLAVITALILANSPLASWYQHIIHLPLEIRFGDWVLKHSLQHWVNEGLMTFFFFLVGMELKREILVGELATLRQALLPIIAAIAGMIVPAIFYFIFNTHGDIARGWAIPMATDIVFALSVLTLLGRQVPKALFAFLIALAIVDDIGAISVIAIFYSNQIDLLALVFAIVLTAVLFTLNRAGVRKIFPYFIIGGLLWFALLQVGVHATLAGVITAFTIPAKPKYSATHFSNKLKELIARFDTCYHSGIGFMKNTQLRGIIQALENSVHQVETPLQRLEHTMHIPVAFLVIPIFVFFNAGIPLDIASVSDSLNHSVTIGIVSGLVLGKFLGISGACWIALKSGVTQLPANTRFSHIAGVALLSGIGFTMSIFIAELSFGNQPQYLLMAKTGILLASLFAGIAGFVLLWIVNQQDGSNAGTLR